MCGCVLQLGRRKVGSDRWRCQDVQGVLVNLARGKDGLTGLDMHSEL